MHKYRSQRNYGCRVHDQFTYRGMRTIVIENDVVRISILADKGTEIFEYLYKPKDLDFMWLSENGVQNPNEYLSTSADPIATFIDYYPGGWQEVFPNGGPTSVYKGAQFGQHGEVAHMPWDYELVEDSPEKVSISFRVKTKKVPYLLVKKLTLKRGSPCLDIEEEVENLSVVPLQYMWGQHVAFGQPFLDQQCRIQLPEGIQIIAEDVDAEEGSGRVQRGVVHSWPNAIGVNGETVDLSQLPKKGSPSEIVYLTGFKDKGWYKLENPQHKAGIKVEWDASAFPYLWYWQEFGETQEYPWYGRHYNIGLEPFSSYPTQGLEAAITNGSAVSIGPREKKKFSMKTMPYSF